MLAVSPPFLSRALRALGLCRATRTCVFGRAVDLARERERAETRRLVEKIIRTLRGIVERPHTSACPYGCAEEPSSTFFTMTAFLPA